MDETRIELDSCILDLEALVAEREGVRTPLTVHERDLLRALRVRKGEPVERSTLLTEVWNYAPSVVSRAVDVTVRRLRQKIEHDPSKPRHLLTVRGVGYRLVVDDVEPQEVPESSVDVPEGPLFGREGDKRALLDWWSGGGRTRVLLGAPGCGKTTLAAWLARSVEPLWWCELRGQLDRESVLRTTAVRVGIPLVRSPSESALIERLGEALASGGRSLLVLDGLARDVELGGALQHWLDVAPGLGILVTANHRPVDLRDVVVHPVEPIDEQAARQLLEHHLGPSWAVAALAARVDGIPGRLVELVGNVAMLGPLPAELPLPTSRYEPAFQEAIDGLSPTSRELLVQLSVFPSEFDLASAMRVHTGPSLVDGVQELREQGVLASTAPGRFRLLDMVREALPEPEPETWARFAEHALSGEVDASRAELERLIAQRVGPDVALAALLELARRGPIDPGRLDALIETSGEPWRSRGRMLRAERATTLEAALADLALARSPDARALECRLLCDAGEVDRALALADVPGLERIRALRLAERDEERPLAEAVAAERRRAGDYAGEVGALTEAAWWSLDLGSPDRAQELALEALAASRLCRDPEVGVLPSAVLAAVGLLRDAGLSPDLDLGEADRAFLGGLARWRVGDREAALDAWSREWPSALARGRAQLAGAWVRCELGDVGGALRLLRPEPPQVPALRRVRAWVLERVRGGDPERPTRPWWVSRDS